MPDYHLLGLGPSHSAVTEVSVKLWGNTLVISCLYEPFGDRQPYQLVFTDTRELVWNVHDTDCLEQGSSDLIGFILGEGKHRKPALLTTDIFELQVLYDSLCVETAIGSRDVLPSN